MSAATIFEAQIFDGMQTPVQAKRLHFAAARSLWAKSGQGMQLDDFALACIVGVANSVCTRGTTGTAGDKAA